MTSKLRELALQRSVFVKETTDERYSSVVLDQRFLALDAKHAFLIRHPAETAPSYYAINPNVDSHQLGFQHLYEIYTAVREVSGQSPLVIDSGDLLRSPSTIIRHFCQWAAIDFLPRALSWSEGHRDEWLQTRRWHEDVSHTRGFERRAPAHGIELVTRPQLKRFVEYHLPFYDKLWRERIPLHRSSPVTP